MFCRELEPDSELKGAVRDGKVFGLGASNMKSGLAAFMVAGKAIKESGATLKGDRLLAVEGALAWGRGGGGNLPPADRSVPVRVLPRRRNRHDPSFDPRHAIRLCDRG